MKPNVYVLIRLCTLAALGSALPHCAATAASDAPAETICTGPKVPDPSGETYPLSPIKLDCTSTVCKSTDLCVAPPAFPKTAGMQMGCRTTNIEEVCDDQVDNNKDLLTDCNDCTCCGSPACAGTPACTCDQLPSGFWLQRYGNYEGLPACVGYANGSIELQQIGCAVYASHQGLGVKQASTGPILPVRLGPHLYQIAWATNVNSGGVQVQDSTLIKIDTEAGTMVGTFQRTEGGKQRPKCAFAAPRL